MGSFSTVVTAFKLSDSLSVATHPWIIHRHLWDRNSLGRRGDGTNVDSAGTPHQPLWRMYAEVIGRFRCNLPKHLAQTGAR
jgi:hypothetical protein